MRQNRKTVLITGASGVLGRHTLMPLLSRGFQVEALYHSKRPDTAAHSELIHWHKVDLLDPLACEQIVKRISPSHLLHFAWDTTPQTCWSTPHNLLWLASSLQLVHAFFACGGERLLTCGTCAEYDWHSQVRMSEFKSPCRPASLYGQSKLALYESVRSFSETHGLSYAHGRLFFTFGPGDHQEKLLPSVVLKLLRGQPADCTSGMQKRDYLYSVDAADAFASILDSDMEGAVNVGSGSATSIRDIVSLAQKQCSPDAIVRFGAIQNRQLDPPCIEADIHRLSTELNWAPAYDIERAVSETVQHLRDTESKQAQE